jgi:hypothetical protein
MWNDKRYEDSVAALFTGLVSRIESPRRYGFRGQAKACWGLKPSIDRKSPPHSTYKQRLDEEGFIVAEFKERAQRFMGTIEALFLQGTTVDFTKLSVLQHYGAPTRVLDWSFSPFAALYFAVINQPKDDGALFFFDRQLLDKNGPNWQEIGCRRRPEDGEADVDSCAFQEDSKPWLCCLNYRIQFDRMKKQAGFFSITGRLGVDHGQEIERMIPSAVYRYTIPADLKNPILDRLEAMNVNSASIGYEGGDHVGWQLACDLERRRAGTANP